jgi:hypothetical protein
MKRSQASARDRCDFVSDLSVPAESTAVIDVMFVCWFGVVEMVWVLRNPRSAAMLMAQMDFRDRETCSPKADNLVP